MPASNPMRFHRAVHSGQFFLIEAIHLMEARQDQKAEALLMEGLESFPQNPQLWHTLGKLLRFDRAQDDRTMNAFANAYALDPTDSPIIMDYAGFLTRKGAFDRAETVYARRYKEEGNDIRLLCALGNHYQTRGMMGLAAACFGHGLTLPDCDLTCHRRYMELVEEHGAHYHSGNWESFQERMQTSIRTILEMPAPAPQSVG